MITVRIGTRGSALARWQADAVADALSRAGVRSELVTISTRGDRTHDVPLASLGGKGVFVTEIHEALRRGDIDLAVHSAKDMPAVSPSGITIAAVLPREDPRDAVILPDPTALPRTLPHASAPSRGHGSHPLPAFGRVPGTRFGTGSPRRIAQLHRIYPNAHFEPIRGNVDTRLRKLDEGSVDALILACAGLRRLGLEHRITSPLSVADCVPAPGQGIIAIEARDTDDRMLELLRPHNDRAAGVALAAEQAVVAELGGGCQLPLGAFAEVNGGRLSIRAIAATSDGTTIIEGETSGSPDNPVEAGMQLARELASRGARQLLNS